MMNLKETLFAALTILSAAALYADFPTGYYDGLNGKNKGALKTAACNAISSKNTPNYGDKTWNAFKTTDKRTVDGVDYWWDMYSNNLVRINSGHGGLNIEHSVPNSWWEGVKNDAYKDIHHLNPSDAEANNRKGNYPLGVVGSNVKYDNGVTKVGSPEGYCGGASMVYEPCDEYKGDFARVYFYMFTAYENMQWGTRFTWMYNPGEKYPMLKPWAQELLLQWSRQDPVSEKEINRNEAVYGIQHNRNPYIDFPDLAEFVWGEKMEELFYVDGNHDPGNNDPEIVSPAEGTIVNFGSVALPESAGRTITVKGKNLEGDLTLTIAGDDAFTLSTALLTASQANAGADVAVTYTPVEEGNSSAVLTISGGGLEQPRQVTILGSAYTLGELEPLTALPATDISGRRYTANWTALDAAPDYYVVNRTFTVNGEVKTRKYMTTDPFYKFTDRDSSKGESYTVQYVRGGRTSPLSNAIEVSADGSGVETVANERAGRTVIPIDGGLMVLANVRGVSLAIYDVQGRLAGWFPSVEQGDIVNLPAGVYIVRLGSYALPAKVMVR